MNVKQQKFMAWSCLLAWCGIIFFFSAQNGEESNALSNLIVVPVLNLVSRFLPIATPQDTVIATDVITTIVRKGAHMTEYAILAILTLRLARLYPLRRKHLAVLLFIVFYASTDEYHQLLGGTRTGQALDVLIDTAGGCIGLTLNHVYHLFHHPNFN